MIITKELDSPWYSWTSTESQIGRRFEFNLDVKPHGRSAALSVDLKDYMETVGDDVKDEITSLQERREEVDVLNQVVGHYEYQVQLEETRRIARIRQGLETEMGFNDDGDAAYVVSSQYDVVWPRTLLVLRKLGFDVKDLDKSTGLTEPLMLVKIALKISVDAVSFSLCLALCSAFLLFLSSSPAVNSLNSTL